MKKTRFTEEQMVTILREADQKPVAEVAKRHGISDQTIYAWRQRYGTLEAADVKRLRQLEQENSRLKKMVADRDLEIDVLKEITPKKMVGAVSTVRLPHDPHLPRAPGPCARHRPDVPPVATGRAPGAEEAAAPTRGYQSTAAASADGD